MTTLSRRNFIKLSGAGLFSTVLAGCGGSDAGTSDGGEKWGEGATLRVGSDCDYAPHSWIQTDDANGAIALADGSGYVEAVIGNGKLTVPSGLPQEALDGDDFKFFKGFFIK